VSDHPELAQTANLARSSAQALSGFAAAVYAGDPAVPRELVPADAIGQLLEALEYLARALASPGAAETFSQAAPLLPDAASQIDFAVATLEIAQSVEAEGRYVVARVKKAYGPSGDPPGPLHVGKTFVPYDDSTLTKAAAEASARSSNDGYRYGPGGMTYVAVRAEPIPGTNKFRNLDHPSLADKAKAPAAAGQRSAASPPSAGQGRPGLVDTTPDLDHTIEIHPGQPLYTGQHDLNRDVLAHYRRHGPGAPHPPTWQADHDDPDLPHRPTVVTYRGRHWVTDGLHRTVVARERGQSITAWHVDPERDRREYEQWAARRQRRAASGPAEFADPVQPAARFSANTGQAAGGHLDRPTRRSGPSRRPARRPTGPGGSQQGRRTGRSGRYRDLREVPATDQAIGADRPRLVLSAARPAGVSGSVPATGTIRMPVSREGV
jgi:hypothetical protein